MNSERLVRLKCLQSKADLARRQFFNGKMSLEAFIAIREEARILKPQDLEKLGASLRCRKGR